MNKQLTLSSSAMCIIAALDEHRAMTLEGIAKATLLPGKVVKADIRRLERGKYISCNKEGIYVLSIYQK